MFAPAVILACICILLVASELLWRRRNLHPEYARKFIHITVGTIVAFWPLFLNRNTILALSGAFVVVVLVAGYFNLFHVIRSVQRPTWGDVFFAIAVGLLAFVAHSSWIYIVALLHMSLADGLAAIVGTRFGRRTRYYVFTHEKTAVGTLTFVAVSLLIFCSYSWLVTGAFSPWFVPITLAAALVENVSIRGLDNLLVPLLVAFSLNLIH